MILLQAMQTIYTSHDFKPIVLELDDELQDKIAKAKEKVLEIALEGIGRPTIELDLPIKTGNDNELHGEKPFSVRVGWDDGISDNVHTRILRVLGEPAQGHVAADLGHYCYEGWDSAVFNQDLEAIPDVWFSPLFTSLITDSDEWISSTVWSFVKEGHRDAFLFALSRDTDREVTVTRDADLRKKLQDIKDYSNALLEQRGRLGNDKERA